jgi:hypothetical protein
LSADHQERRHESRKNLEFIIRVGELLTDEEEKLPQASKRGLKYMSWVEYKSKKLLE